jgi:hypothetical protein
MAEHPFDDPQLYRAAGVLSGELYRSRKGFVNLRLPCGAKVKLLSSPLRKAVLLALVQHHRHSGDGAAVAIYGFPRADQDDGILWGLVVANFAPLAAGRPTERALSLFGIGEIWICGDVVEQIEGRLTALIRENPCAWRKRKAQEWTITGWCEEPLQAGSRALLLGGVGAGGRLELVLDRLVESTRAEQLTLAGT